LSANIFSITYQLTAEGGNQSYLPSAESETETGKARPATQENRGVSLIFSLECGNFEGVIPKGNYGAGEVIIRDKSSCDQIGDMKGGTVLHSSVCHRLHARMSSIEIILR
jgi:hypothetical protein